jgi:hypothetical protein
MRLRAQPITPGGDIFEPATHGVSAAARLVHKSIEEAWEHWQETITSRRGTLEREFHRLARQWKEETEFQSAAERIAMHPAYQRIIGMGKEALPFILHDLQETHDLWFWALAAITGENPVPEEDRGYIDRMVRAWIRWGMRRNVI